MMRTRADSVARSQEIDFPRPLAPGQAVTEPQTNEKRIPPSKELETGRPPPQGAPDPTAPPLLFPTVRRVVTNRVWSRDPRAPVPRRFFADAFTPCVPPLQHGTRGARYKYKQIIHCSRRPSHPPLLFANAGLVAHGADLRLNRPRAVIVLQKLQPLGT